MAGVARAHEGKHLDSFPDQQQPALQLSTGFLLLVHVWGHVW